VNPARSIASALFGGGVAWAQLWLFVVAPLIGGGLGALAWRYLLSPGEGDENIGQVP
jgi:aquaporin Z